MMISQRRIVLAITGTRPMEKMRARAAGGHVSEGQAQRGVDLLRCFLLNLISGSSGNGKSNSTISVPTLIAAETCMKSVPLIQPCGWLSMSHARDIGRHASSWACGRVSDVIRYQEGLGSPQSWLPLPQSSGQRSPKLLGLAQRMEVLACPIQSGSTMPKCSS